MSGPTCPGCEVVMVERKNPTAEQAWCGTWFDHPPVSLGGCTKYPTILDPSDALLRQNEELRAEHEALLDLDPTDPDHTEGSE